MHINAFAYFASKLTLAQHKSVFMLTCRLTRETTLLCERNWTDVVPNFAPCQIMHPLLLVGLGVGVGEGLGLGMGLGLGNQVAISTRGCIIWQGCRIRHNTGQLPVTSYSASSVICVDVICVS